MKYRTALPILLVALAALVVGVAAPASADSGGASGYSNDPNADASFYHVLTGYPEDPDNMTIWNIALVKAQGLWACQQETNGMGHGYVVDKIAAAGYTREDAISIDSSASAVYCPSNNYPPMGHGTY
jgi:hypothetical protein